MGEYTIKILSKKKLSNPEIRNSLKNLGGRKTLEKKNGLLFEICYSFTTISSSQTFSKIMKGVYGNQISIKKLNKRSRSRSRSSSPKKRKSRSRSKSRSSSPKKRKSKNRSSSRSSSPKRRKSRSPSPLRSLRPSPSISATIQPLGKILRGGDGKNWIVKQLGNSKRWARLK